MVVPAARTAPLTMTAMPTGLLKKSTIADVNDLLLATNAACSMPEEEEEDEDTKLLSLSAADDELLSMSVADELSVAVDVVVLFV